MVGVKFLAHSLHSVGHHPEHMEFIMLSLLFFTACLEKPQEPTEPIDPPGGASCSELISEMEWEEEPPEGLSMARFMENIPESFTTTAILGENEDAPACLNASLIVDQDSLAYVESEVVEAEGEISNMMQPLCYNHLKADATLVLLTEDGSLAEELAIELRIEFNELEESAPFATLQAEIDALEGSISSLLPNEEIEGMYMSGSINEEGFSGSINATTLEEDGEIIKSIYHELAQWNGAIEESCE